MVELKIYLKHDQKFYIMEANLLNIKMLNYFASIAINLKRNKVPS